MALVGCDDARMDDGELKRWGELLDAVATFTSVRVARPDEEAAARLSESGLPARVLRHILIGYPSEPVLIGTLTFFPPLRDARSRMPHLFYIGEAWTSSSDFKRHLRSLDAAPETSAQSASAQSASAQETSAQSTSAAKPAERALSRSDPSELMEDELVRAAIAYLHAIGESKATEEEPRRPSPWRFWLPAAERALEDRVGPSALPRVLAILASATRWQDYQDEIERRLMIARLWSLLGIALAVAAVSQSGGLSGRLLVAFAAFAIFGVGLGISPWMRDKERRRDLESRRVGERSEP